MEETMLDRLFAERRDRNTYRFRREDADYRALAVTLFPSKRDFRAANLAPRSPSKHR